MRIRALILRMIPYIFVVIVICASMYVFFDLYATNLSMYPIRYSSGGDGITGLVTAKAMKEFGWIYNNPALGAPYGVENYDFTTMELFLCGIEQLLITVTDNWILGYNLFYLSAYILTGVIALYVLQKLNISDVIAAPSAILYAFVPYHIQRGTGHLYLGMYYMVPLMVLYLYRLMKDEQVFSKGVTIFHKDKTGWFTWSNIIRVGTLMIMALTGIYYAFFMCFFLCVVALCHILNNNGWKKIRQVGFCLLVIMTTIVLGALPNLIYWAQNGQTEVVSTKGGEGAEIYALKIIQLLLPIQNHRLTFFAKIRNFYDSYYPLVNENGMSSLGVYMSLGFIVLCVVLFIHNKLERQSNLRIGSLLNLSAILFGTVGGYAVILSFVSGAIRCYNRFSIFIAMFSLIAIAECLQWLYLKIAKINKWIQFLFCFGMLIVLACGLLDQITSMDAREYAIRNERYEQDDAFIQAIELLEEENSMIYQLPYMRYPENGSIHNMQDYAHMMGYLHSDSLRWSYGAIAGREGDQWMASVNELGFEEQLTVIKEAGFAGVYIDWNAYLEDERAVMEEMLKEKVDTEPIVNESGTKAYYSFQ